MFILLLFLAKDAFCRGFCGHRKVNCYAVFLLPPPMLLLATSKSIGFISEHAVGPDKRRNLLRQEGARHYIDIDRYGSYPFDRFAREGGTVQWPGLVKTQAIIWKRVVEVQRLPILIEI
jgi:hypothetical protein